MPSNNSGIKRGSYVGVKCLSSWLHGCDDSSWTFAWYSHRLKVMIATTTNARKNSAHPKCIHPGYPLAAMASGLGGLVCFSATTGLVCFSATAGLRTLGNFWIWVGFAGLVAIATCGGGGKAALVADLSCLRLRSLLSFADRSNSLSSSLDSSDVEKTSLATGLNRWRRVDRWKWYKEEVEEDPVSGVTVMWWWCCWLRTCLLKSWGVE